MYKIKSSGFTLIELLVVVLIIGVLAAIAIPQYQIAVAKSRLSSVMPMVRALKDAQESYYLVNGQYTDDLNKLELSFDYTNHGNSSISGGWVSFDNGTYLDSLPNGPTDFNRASIHAGIGKRDNYVVLYEMYLNHSSTPGRVTCTGYNDIGNKVCTSLGF